MAVVIVLLFHCHWCDHCYECHCCSYRGYHYWALPLLLLSMCCYWSLVLVFIYHTYHCYCISYYDYGSYLCGVKSVLPKIRCSGSKCSNRHFQTRAPTTSPTRNLLDPLYTDSWTMPLKIRCWKKESLWAPWRVIDHKDGVHSLMPARLRMPDMCSEARFSDRYQLAGGHCW